MGSPGAVMETLLLPPPQILDTHRLAGDHLLPASSHRLCLCVCLSDSPSSYGHQSHWLRAAPRPRLHSLSSQTSRHAHAHRPHILERQHIRGHVRLTALRQDTQVSVPEPARMVSSHPESLLRWFSQLDSTQLLVRKLCPEGLAFHRCLTCVTVQPGRATGRAGSPSRKETQWPQAGNPEEM